jgi:hypothetical protein
MTVLGTLMHLLEPMASDSLAALLDLDVEELRGILLPLSAVIFLPDDTARAIQIIHLSFREFMLSDIQDMRANLLCGTSDQHSSLVSHLFCVMHKGLRFNICDLPTSYLRNSEVPDLQRRLETYIPQELRYSCRFWADHLTDAPCTLDLSQAATNFLFDQLLFWLEIMSLLGIVRSAPQALSKFSLWIDQVRVIFPDCEPQCD